MYELLMRSRWIIAIFMVITIGSIVGYVGNSRSVDESAAVSPREVETIDNGPGSDGDAPSAATRSGEDPLIDKTIGEDVRPEEEKAAEAAALAAAAAQARMQPVLSDGAEAAAEGE